MSRKYRKIDPRIWNDAKFRSMSDNGKLVFFLVLTHPHMTSLGAMRATLDGLAAELGWQSKAFREAFLEASTKGLLRLDERSCFISAPKFLKYNPPESPNVIKSWIGAWDLIPECDAKYLLAQEVKAFAQALGEAFARALPKDFAKAMPNQEQEQEQEQVKEYCADKSAVSDLELDKWVQRWNQWKVSGLVAAGVDSKPSKGVRAGWTRVKKDPELRELLSDPLAIEKALRDAPFCRKEWFTLPKLLGASSAKDGEYFVRNLLNGVYKDQTASQPTTQQLKTLTPKPHRTQEPIR